MFISYIKDSIKFTIFIKTILSNIGYTKSIKYQMENPISTKIFFVFGIICNFLTLTQKAGIPANEAINIPGKISRAEEMLTRLWLK